MKLSLDTALTAAECFGAETVTNNSSYWSEADREGIANHYGVGEWASVPVDYQRMLFHKYLDGISTEENNRKQL